MAPVLELSHLRRTSLSPVVPVGLRMFLHDFFVRVSLCLWVWLWVDGCEVRPCDPFARVRPCVPCVPCVSRLPPGVFLPPPRCLFTEPGT